METAESSTTTPIKKRKEQSESVKLYLAIYNLVQFLGWGYGLIQTINFLLFKSTKTSGTNFRQLWDNCSLTIMIFQTYQFAEVIHAALRFVPSNPFQTFTQIFSRLMLVWGVLYPVPEARDSLGVPLLLIAWCIAEITRYSYYALNIYNLVPFICTWARYTLFIVLYPMGVTGELLTTYASLKYIRNRKLLTLELPNPLNISFYYDIALIIFMLSYFHFFPQLYLYMLRTRRKVLGPSQCSKSD